MAAGVAIGMQVFGGLLGMAGNIHQANMQAQANEYNAQMDDQQADLTLQQGEEDAFRERYAVKKTLGSIRAAYGASGVRMDGTPQEYMDAQAAVGAKNIMSIKNQSIIKANALRTEASMLRGQKGDIMLGGFLGAGAAGANASAQILKRT